MKRTTLYILILMTLPAILNAQYLGGIGRGDASLFLSDIPLAVELTSFTSDISGRNITLNWVTASEQNNFGFDVERKILAGNFIKVGFIEGKGTVNTLSYYSFVDKNLHTGIYQYRLKQLDNNGNFNYFELSENAEIEIPAKFFLSQNYPNPFNPTTKIDFELPADCKVTIKVYDITGRIIKILLNDEFRPADYYSVDFDASGFASGIYFYKFETGEFSSVKRMVYIK
jgi:hypothetical protein